MTTFDRSMNRAQWESDIASCGASRYGRQEAMLVALRNLYSTHLPQCTYVAIGGKMECGTYYVPCRPWADSVPMTPAHIAAAKSGGARWATRVVYGPCSKLP